MFLWFSLWGGGGGEGEGELHALRCLNFMMTSGPRRSPASSTHGLSCAWRYMEPMSGTSNGSGQEEEKKVASAKEKSIQWGSRSVDIFEKIDQIGEGTYG